MRQTFFLRVCQQTHLTPKSVILSEQSEPKDLRTSVSAEQWGKCEDPSTPFHSAQDDRLDGREELTGISNNAIPYNCTASFGTKTGCLREIPRQPHFYKVMIPQPRASASLRSWVTRIRAAFVSATWAIT